MNRIALMLFLSMFPLYGVSSAPVGLEMGGALYINSDYRERYWLNHRAPEPEYPEKEMRAKQSACVTVMFRIGSNGKVYDRSVVRNYPDDNGHFHNSAMRAIRKFRFKPSGENKERREVITTHMFKYLASDKPTKKAHEAMAVNMENEFQQACEVVFEKRKK